MLKKLLLTLALLLACVAANAEPASELTADEVEYDSRSGLMVATGHVVLRHEGGVATCEHGTYNVNTRTGELRGNVVVDRDDLHLTCDTVALTPGSRIVASGNVLATRGAQSFSGSRAEYTPESRYVLLPSGGTVRTEDGTFTADHMEGWLDDNHCRGEGNAHIVAPAKNFEGGGDVAEYFGAESKALLIGNAWAVQDNHTLRSHKLTVLLDKQHNVQVR